MAKKAARPETGPLDVEVREGILDLLGAKIAPENLAAAIERIATQKVSTVFCTQYPVEDQHLPAFGLLAEMTVLGLMMTRVAGAGIPQLAVVPTLEVLDLTGCPLTGEGIDALPDFRALQKFRASGTGVPLSALRPLVRTSVNYLELDELPMTEDDLGWILEIPHLNELCLSGTLLTPNVMKLLRRVPRRLHVRITHAAHLQDQIPLEDRVSEKLHVILL